jgi:UDP-N-acetylglucosamine:LPS N-acetylglucosamine transferase
MQRRILLAWELGGGSGHVLRLRWIAEALRQRGYDPVFAIQRLDMRENFGASVGESAFYQAPVWPALIDRSAYSTPRRAVTMADVLADFGMHKPAAVKSMIQAWDRLISLIDPAAVVADFAPACLMAARGRVPSIAVGDGFTLPPAELRQFKQFEPEIVTPKHDESSIVAAVNESLLAHGRSPIGSLPEIFSSDRSCPGAFTELDPYASERTIPAAAPWVPAWDRNVPMERNELFGYFSVNAVVQAPLFFALTQVASSGVRVRLHVPQLRSNVAVRLTSTGMILEPKPVPFEEIQRRARLVISYGSSGLVSCALAAGIPQIIVPVGIAKGATGRAVERLGVGHCFQVKSGNPLESSLLSQVILEACNEDEFVAVAKKLAPDFARRLEPRPADVVAGYVDELV